jgi:hypothetical protein
LLAGRCSQDLGLVGDYVKAMGLMILQGEHEGNVIATGISYSVKNLIQIAFPCMRSVEPILSKWVYLISMIFLSLSVVFFPSLEANSETNQFNIHKFITAYDFNESDIPFIASHFDLIDTSLGKANQIQKIKSLNPSFKAIFYKDALTHREGATESWYVRDAQTGSRLINKDWGWYLMDIGNQAYRNSLASSIKNSLANNPVFDGVFLDDVWGAATLGEFYREGTKELAVLPPHVIKYLHDNMKLLIIQIKMAIGRKLLIINTGAFNTDYLALSDGQMYEGFCHANWEAFGEYYPEWRKMLHRMIIASASGKIYLAQSGIQKWATESQTIKTARYCYSMFLLGANSNSFFYFSKNYRGVTYFPEWDVDIGSPIEDYRARAGTPLYEREYSKGLVVINPSSESVQINFGTKYKTRDGAVTDTIRMEDHEGEILLKHTED